MPGKKNVDKRGSFSSVSHGEYEYLDWVVGHGLGVIHTGDMTAFHSILAQVGVVKGIESYYYMRYDDSPERNYLPMMFYTVFGNPDVPVLLHEEVEPEGELWNAIILFSSNLLVEKTSQRALLFDGAKKDAVLVVNTSLKPEDVVKLVKKYNLSQDWKGKVVTVSAGKIDSSIAFPLLGALAKGWKKISIDDVLKALEMLGKEDKSDSVKKGYENAKVMDVNIKAEETEMFNKKKEKVILPEFTGKPMTQKEYYQYQYAAANAKSYSERISAMPRWEVLVPGLIEFGPEKGKRNVGFTTPWRFTRPVIDLKKCIDCKLCHLYCPDGAIDFSPIKVDYSYCKGCATCAVVCPTKAITMVPELEYLEGLKDEETPAIRVETREYGF